MHDPDTNPLKVTKKVIFHNLKCIFNANYNEIKTDNKYPHRAWATVFKCVNHHR